MDATDYRWQSCYLASPHRRMKSAVRMTTLGPPTRTQNASAERQTGPPRRLSFGSVIGAEPSATEQTARGAPLPSDESGTPSRMWSMNALGIECTTLPVAMTAPLAAAFVAQ